MDVMTPRPVGSARARERAERPSARAQQPLTGQVLRIWRDVLGMEVDPTEVDPRANFFDLGGSALEALLVVSQVSTRFGVELPLSTLFDYPTAAEFAAALAVHVDSADRDHRSDR
jgi:acyl carrier protein